MISLVKDLKDPNIHRQTLIAIKRMFSEEIRQGWLVVGLGEDEFFHNPKHKNRAHNGDARGVAQCRSSSHAGPGWGLRTRQRREKAASPLVGQCRLRQCAASQLRAEFAAEDRGDLGHKNRWQGCGVPMQTKITQSLQLNNGKTMPITLLTHVRATVKRLPPVLEARQGRLSASAVGPVNPMTNLKLKKLHTRRGTIQPSSRAC